MAVNDFVTLWFATETPYQDDLDMILWRINEYYPLNCSTTETERYQRFPVNWKTQPIWLKQ
jgi:hypothetical protein